MRIYYEIGMQTELKKIGTLKLEPIFKFRDVVNKSKSNIENEIYNELVKFYEYISKETSVNLFEPMKLFLNKKVII